MQTSADFARVRKGPAADSIGSLPARILLAVLALLTGNALADSYRSVSPGSQLRFTSWFEGEAAQGEFGRFEVGVETEPVTGLPESIRVAVDVSSATMGSPELDDGMAEPEWFDFAAFPQASFESEVIQAVSGSEYLAAGKLRIKGVEKAASFSFEWQSHGTTASMSGATELSRLAFNIGSGEWSDTSSIKDKVLVSFEVALIESAP